MALLCKNGVGTSGSVQTAKTGGEKKTGRVWTVLSCRSNVLSCRSNLSMSDAVQISFQISFSACSFAVGPLGLGTSAAIRRSAQS
jgi:hypothetical protein